MTTTATWALAAVAAAACAGCLPGARDAQGSDTYVETRSMFAPADTYGSQIDACATQHVCQPLCRTLFAVPATIVVDRCAITSSDATGALVMLTYTKSSPTSSDVVVGTWVGDDDISADDDDGDDGDDDGGYYGDDGGSGNDTGDGGDDSGDDGGDGGDDGGGDDGGDSRIAPNHHLQAPAVPHNPTAGRQLR